MRHLIVGTAGHIDHGKTSLVRALTGIDTDRLEEEKRRGISIDLGFANLQIGQDLRIGIVDVPGHERFVKNMLAGVGGIDLVLFVVAADESIKPQTREHFDICRLLQIPRGIVVLTKSDLVDPDLLELVRLEVDEFVAGSFLENAPVIAVSSTTGSGIEDLKQALRSAAVTIPLKDASRRTRLPLDRAFSMRGFGTVVTGTLAAGTLQLEQELEIQPSTSNQRVRVRGLQVHGSAVKKAVAGQRTAVNIAGAEPGDLARGMVLTEPGILRATQTIDATLDLLPTSPVPLKHQMPVHFHAGTSEVEASIRLLQDGTSSKPVPPGSRAYVRILLKHPVLLLPGDRFIIRMFSPVITIGGGSVLEIAPPPRMKRVATLKRLQTMETGSIRDRLALYVRESRFGLTAAELVTRTGWLQQEIDSNLDDGLLVVTHQQQQIYVDREWAHGRVAKFREILKDYHRKNPLQPGLPKEELRSRELAGAPPYLLDALVHLVRDVVAEGEIVRLASHKVQFQEDEAAAVAKIEAAFESAGLAVPSTGEVLAKSGVEPARAKSLLVILLKQQKLVKAGEDLLFHHSAIAKLKQLLSVRKGQKFGVPEFKEWTGVSRKYAIPLLEFLDREKVTRREGDSRLVL
jgi:selenocysteine-specific elongation factor